MWKSAAVVVTEAPRRNTPDTPQPGKGASPFTEEHSGQLKEPTVGANNGLDGLQGTTAGQSELPNATFVEHS